MTDNLTKIFVSVCGAVGTFVSKVIYLDILDNAAFGQLWEYIEAFVLEVRQDFASGLIGASAGIAVLYVKEKLKLLYAFLRGNKGDGKESQQQKQQ